MYVTKMRRLVLELLEWLEIELDVYVMRCIDLLLFPLVSLVAYRSVIWLSENQHTQFNFWSSNQLASIQVRRSFLSLFCCSY